MQHNLRNAAPPVPRGVRRRGRSAPLTLQVGPVTARDGARSTTRIGTKHGWIQSEHPRLVSDIFIVDAEGPILRIRRFDAETHAFEPTSWPDDVARWRPDFERQLRDFNAGQSDRRPLPLTATRRSSPAHHRWPAPTSNLIGPGNPRPARVPHRSRRSSASPSSGSTSSTCRSKSCRRSRGAISSTRTATLSRRRGRVTPSRVLYRSDPERSGRSGQRRRDRVFFGRVGAAFFARRRRRRRAPRSARPRRAAPAAGVRGVTT